MPVQADIAASWGLFDQLAGQELRSSDGGYTLRFSWVRPGEELRQEWIHPRTGKVMGTSVMVRDAATGQLREGKTAEAAVKGYLGKPGIDGSVDFLKGGSGYRWQWAPDGFVERADLKFAGGNLTAKPAPSYARWAVSTPASAPTSAPALAAQGTALPSGPIILAGGPAAGVTAVPNGPIPTPTGPAGPRVVDLPPGITAPGKLAATAELDAQGRPFRCYAFSVPPGTRVRISMSSKEFPPLLRLAPGSHCGSAKVSSEAQPQQGRAQLSAVLTAGGNHVLLVGSGTPGSTGRFLVSLESEGPVGGASAAPSRVAAMQAQTAAYQAELDRRAREERLRREREEREAREAAAEERAAEERRAANFKRALEELGKIATSVPK